MPGRLRHYVNYQSTSNTQNARSNEDQIGYTTVRAVWVSIEPIGGKEFQIASTINANIRYKVKVRTMIGVTDSIVASDRFVRISDSLTLNVVYHEQQFQTQDRYTVCYCTLEENPDT